MESLFLGQNKNAAETGRQLINVHSIVTVIFERNLV
jgi:hypothetical protein